MAGRAGDWACLSLASWLRGVRRLLTNGRVPRDSTAGEPPALSLTAMCHPAVDRPGSNTAWHRICRQVTRKIAWCGEAVFVFGDASGLDLELLRCRLPASAKE